MIETLTAKIERQKNRKTSIDAFLKDLEDQKSLVTEFSEEMFTSLLDFITVYTTEDVRLPSRMETRSP